VRIVGKVLLVLLIFLLVLAVVASGLFLWTVRRSFPEAAGSVVVPGLRSSVEVIRDERGIPNIYADTPGDLYAALGYVHAQDRFYEMDVRRHITAGRLSEMFGDGQVDTDAFLRAMDWRGVAEQEFGLLSEESQDILTAYARGVNNYLADRSSAEISLEYVALGLTNPDYRIEEWDPVDSVAWLKALAWDLNGNYDAEIARVLTAAEVGVRRTEELYPPYPYDRNGTIVGDAADPRRASPAAGGAEAAAAAAAVTAEPGARGAFRRAAAAGARLAAVLGPRGEGIGSNSWVVSGELTESGKPLLANDPHLAPGMPSLWYQAGLHCRKVSAQCPFDVAGWTLAGVPGVIIGHNSTIAWGLTNLGPDVSDLVLEKVRGRKYLVDGRRRPLLIRRDTIKVAGGADVPITIRSTSNGPILSDSPGAATYGDVAAAAPAVVPGGNGAGKKPADGYAVAMRWTALTPRPTFDAITDLNRAQDWQQFRRAAAKLSVPSQNLVYADTSGAIGYQAPGEIPVRQGYDGKWPVPGWDSRYSWSDFIGFEQLPSLTDPPAGWITTANQTVLPEGSTVPLQTDPYSYGARARRINTALSELIGSGEKLTTTDMQQVQLDAGNDLAEFLVPKLRRMPVAESTRAALQLLADWDYQQPEDSAAGAFFNAFYSQLVKRVFTDEIGDGAQVAPNAGDRYWEVIRTLWPQKRNKWWDDAAVDGRQNRRATVTAALDAAAEEMRGLQGGDPSGWRWGDMHLVEARNATLGKSGIAPIERIFNRGPLPVGGGSSIPLATGWQPGKGYGVTWIPSMRQVIDMSDLDASTWVNFTGNSGHAFHPNYVDQFDAWVDGGQFPWPFTRAAVQTAGTDSLTLTPQ
jgi:penicillin amidase